MSQLIANSGQFQRPRAAVTAGTVSFMDKPAVSAKVAPRPFAVWPVVIIGFGGVATLAWNGFLIWQTARTVFGWVIGA